VSPLEQALADYLRLRRSLGHDLAEAGWLLPGFVAYLDAHGATTSMSRVPWNFGGGPGDRQAAVLV
jgi:hypothetical protein